MRLFTSVIVAVLLFTGCTKTEQKTDPLKAIGCLMGKAVALGVSQELAAALECKKPEAVNQWVVNQLVTLRVCDAAPKNELGLQASNAMCEMVGSVIISQIVTLAVPADWGCSGADVKAKITAAVQKACGKL